MIYLQLFIEFFLVGLLSVGGGLATIPFLTDMGQRTGWFSLDQLTNMIAISESTPGPLGVNMASYAGYQTAGIFGGAVATVGLITPSIIVILIVAAILVKFRDNPHVKAVFSGLRPASMGLIAAAGWSVICLTFFTLTWGNGFLPEHIAISWKCLAVAAAVLFFTHWSKTKKAHPVLWIALSAIAGIAFEM